MNTLSERYIKLILKTGLFDPDYVDAYYGPSALKNESEKARGTLNIGLLKEEAGELIHSVRQSDFYGPKSDCRRLYLIKQVHSCFFRLRMLDGESFSFDEESMNLYDAVAPTYGASYFEGLLKELDSVLPGKGSVSSRVTEYRKDYIIPKPLLDSVFHLAIGECRDRSRKYLQLPEGEKFIIEYVSDKPWSGYNWYRGDFFSLIQINTDLPVYIDRAIDLACHEGYPGHHVYNALIESELVRKLDWKECTIYPLFSPQSLIAEGTANFGIELTFPGKERVMFESDCLFPACGFDPAGAEQYYRVHELTQRLAYAGNEAARGYLDKTMKYEDAVQWLVEYGLFSPERAAQRIKFFDAYRSYVINYNLGLDLVRSYINHKTLGASDPLSRWSMFHQMLTEPIMPSQLTQISNGKI